MFLKLKISYVKHIRELLIPDPITVQPSLFKESKAEASMQILDPALITIICVHCLLSAMLSFCI